MEQSLQVWLAITMGGALGSTLRHGANMAISAVTTHVVPAGVAAVNVAGCLAIGLLAGAIATDQWSPSVPVRAFVFTGLLGGFTTFSSFGLDALTLVQQGKLLMAAANIGVQVGLGIAAVFAGYMFWSR
jgi:CrcB protein